MRPTPEETLAGAARLLRGLLEEPDLPAVATETVNDVLRMIGQATRVVTEAPTFLAEDNERLRSLLADLIRELPPTEVSATQRISAYLTERTTLDPH